MGGDAEGVDVGGDAEGVDVGGDAEGVDVGRASNKVPGGKMVEVEVQEGGVRLTGDFFVHPESAVEGLERVLRRELESSETEVRAAVERYLEEEGVQMLGFDAAALAETLVEARG